MTIVHKPLTFKNPETEDDPRVLEDAVLTLMVAATLGSGARTRARAETSSGRSRSVAPVPGWAPVWQAVADLPPLRAGASNSESLSLSPVPGSRERGPLSTALCVKQDNYCHHHSV